MTTTKELLIEALESHGFDGLCDPDNTCGCGIDDLMPCDNYHNPITHCQPAYKVPCKGEKCLYPCNAYEGKQLEACYTTKKGE